MQAHLTNQHQQKNLPDRFFRIPDYIPEQNSELSHLTKEQRREIAMLNAIGLENYEIQYLMQLKRKEKLRQKWLR